MKRSVVAGLVILGIVGAFWVLFHPTKPYPKTPGFPLAGNSAASSERELAAAQSNGPEGAVLTQKGAVALSKEFDPAINPYAGALKEPGKSRRAWDPDFIRQFQNASSGDAIRFELSDGRMAAGTISLTQNREGQISYLAGQLTAPGPGKFFFSTPPTLGKAGKAVGVIEFPASQTAYRIEPTGPNGDPEFWQRRLDEVICLSMPLAEGAAATNDNETANIPPLRPGGMPEIVPSYNSNIVSLQSFPGSSAVLLLDFFGGYTPTWGGAAYPRASVNNSQIKDLWKRVAEDFMGFNINVTTDIKVFQSAPATSRQRCVFTPSTPAMPAGAAGVAYIGSWNWGDDTVCWSIYTSGKNGGEVGSHEPGHTLGLGHQGTSTSGYSTGQGSGVTGWCPIMGAGYYQPVTTWAKGEYADANNTEDELVKITTQNNNVTYRPDDGGANLATARFLDIYPDMAAFGEGVIERTGDTDAFKFTTSGGQVSLTVRPVGDWADLAVSATLADATDTIINSNNPQTVLSASISTNLPAGTYTFRVTGVGRNNVLTTGFSSYSSLGYYSIIGSVAGATLPNRFSVIEKAANGTTVGTVPAANPADTLAYAIVSGNSNNTFAIDAAGGLLTVANNTLLNYARWSTNNMLAVQFELLVNITDLTNPGMTELNRRVVIELRGTNVNYPVAVTGFNAGVIVPYNASGTVPMATAFDIFNNWAFYQAGLNDNLQVGGSGGAQGLPSGGSFISQLDGSSFQFGPYGNTNALLMGRGFPTSGTLTLVTPQSYNSLAVLAASANGGGFGSVVLTFTNGTKSPVFSLSAQDWFNGTTNIALQGMGRVRLGLATLQTEDNGGTNPNLYQSTINLAALGLNLPVASITFTNPVAGAAQNSGVLAVSGSLMPPQVVIAKQPQSLTNNNPAVAAILSVAAMGEDPLTYQWYSGNPGSGTLLPGKTSTNLTFNPATTNDQGNYYVIVTNNQNAVTSSVATLTVYGAPVISTNLSPTNLFLLSGQTARFFVSAKAAAPLSYYWQSNGLPIAFAATSNYTIVNVQLSHSAAYSVILSNAYGMATSSVASLTVFPSASYPYAQRVVADSPKGYWRLDETNGTVAHDYVGGNNGVFTNVLLGQAGNNLIDLHKSARFGSLATSNSYVGSLPIDFGTTTNSNFTVETWVNGGTQTSDCGLITRGTGSGGEQFDLDCGGASRAFRFLVRDSTGAARLASGTVIPNNQWHHVVGVCNETNGQVLLYVDGVQNASGSIPIGSGILASTNETTFGSRRGGATTPYNFQYLGNMEEVAIYNYALTPSQILAHYNASSNRPPVFLANPFTEPAINAGVSYATLSATIATNATEPNNDTIIFAKVSGPAWLTVASGGALSGVPSNANAGTNTFVVSARDAAGASNTAALYIYVNGAPSFTSNPITLPQVNVGQALTGTISGTATDPNSDPLVYSKVSGAAWLAVAADGSVSGTPGAGDVGTNSFTVRATDPNGLNSTATLLINVNGAPAFAANPFTLSSAQVDQPYSGSIASAANDPNPSDNLTFLKTSGPAWLSVAPNGDVSGTPGSPDLGTNNFGVQATDSGGLSASATLKIIVAAGPIVSSLSTDGSQFFLSWTGGSSPFQVQMASNLLNAAWQPFAGPLITNSITFPATNPGSLFFRVLGQ